MKTMRISTMLLAFAMIAPMSTTAFAQKSKRAKAASVAEIDRANSNENSWRFLKDGLPLYMPTAVSIFMLHQKSLESKKSSSRTR
jgi:hypothetical protein